jgi:large conductance mechanosensitive channel
MRGFKNFLLRGDVIVIAVGLVVALAFSMLITAFTTNIITPIVAAAGGKAGLGLGFYVSDHNPRTFVDFGKFISAIINFVIFMAVVYFVIVLPYKAIQARRGQVVFGDPAPVKSHGGAMSPVR